MLLLDSEWRFLFCLRDRVAWHQFDIADLFKCFSSYKSRSFLEWAWGKIQTGLLETAFLRSNSLNCLLVLRISRQNWWLREYLFDLICSSHDRRDVSRGSELVFYRAPNIELRLRSIQASRSLRWSRPCTFLFHRITTLARKRPNKLPAFELFDVTARGSGAW